MFNHTPSNYKCPICLAIKEVENGDTMIRQDDIVYKDAKIIAFIGSKFAVNNPGHVLISPTEHYENIYDLSALVAHRIFDLAKYIAVALKEVRKCGGTTTLQCNEPVGNQHAFHFHFHVFPRFKGDDLFKNLLNMQVSVPEDRKVYSRKLREYILKHPVNF